jgi:hypothetical protein
MSRLLGLSLLTVAAFASGQDRKPTAKSPAPKLTVAVPLTVAPGQKVKLTVHGLNLDGLTDVRMHEPKSRAKLAGAPKKQTLPQNAPAERIGDWTVEIELDLAKELPAGSIAFTVVGPGGESNAVKVAVDDDTPRVAEKEPNEGFATAQPIAAPCIVEGTIGRERDVDVFRISGKAGEKLRLEVQAARLGSPVDALLTLHDSAGRVIASEDDTNGSADPILSVVLPRDGDYFVSLIDANDLGGPAFAYRLVVKKE